MTLLQTISVAAKATGDVEVPILSKQILARSQMHDVWMDLEPSRPRTCRTSWVIEAPTEVQDKWQFRKPGRRGRLV